MYKLFGSVSVLVLLSACGAPADAPAPAEPPAQTAADPDGADHSGMDHSAMDHAAMDHGSDHGAHSSGSEMTRATATLETDDFTLTLADIYVLTPPGGRDVTAGYLNLSVDGQAMTLISASSPAVDVVELHDHIRDEETGGMAMIQIAEVPVSPDEPVAFVSGGKHLMLYGASDLTAGDMIDVTFTFAEGPVVTVEVPVEAR